MAGCQPVAGRCLDFLASFARETKDSLPKEVCHVYVKQILDEGEDLDIAALSLQAAVTAKKPSWLAKPGRDWERLLQKFPGNGGKLPTEKRLIHHLTAIWTREVLEHYGWHKQTKKFLQPLYQCAKTWPHFESQFVPRASCILVSRQEACIVGTGSQTLKPIGFHRRTESRASANFDSPLLIRDVDLLSKWSKGVAVRGYGGEVFPAQPTETMLKRVRRWVDDVDGSIVVDGQSVRARGKPVQAYNVIFDRYGLVIHSNEEHAMPPSTGKRQREEHVAAEEEATTKPSENGTPVQKKARTDSALKYPSPPTSSPHPTIPSQESSVQSSPPSFIEDEDDSEGDAGKNEQRDSATSTVSSFGNESSQSTEAGICNATQTRPPTSPRDDHHASPKPETSSQTHVRTQAMGLDSPSLPVPFPRETNIPPRLESTSQYQQHLDSTQQTVSEPPLEHQGYLYLCNGDSASRSSSDQSALRTSHFDAQFFPPSSTSSPNRPECQPANIASLFQYVNSPSGRSRIPTQPLHSSTSMHSFSTLLTFPPDTPIDVTVPPTGSNLFLGEIQGPCDNTRSDNYTESTQEPERCQSLRGTEPVSFNPTSRHSLPLPSFRAMASSTDTSFPAIFSASSLSSSSLEGGLETGSENSQASGLDKDSDGDLISEPQDTEAQTELCSTESPCLHPSSQDCPTCNGVCNICQVPIGFDRRMRNKLFKFGHSAYELEKKAPSETLRAWIRSVVFASYDLDTTEGEGDVCSLSLESFRTLAGAGHVFRKPVILREHFADSKEWSPSEYAHLLEFAFADVEVDVRWHEQREPERVAVSTLVELLRSQPSTSLSRNPPNVLNLPDITNAISPSFLRMRRFRLLDMVVARCKADLVKHVGKQISLTPFDIGSCQKFNILGWPGAFSGPHVDSNGATWVRNLFGYKLWMFVPKFEMKADDWKQFAIDGDSWDPKGKCRAVILEPGDVFVMESGLIHAVYTLGDKEPCLMTGGVFWDQSDLLCSLETWFWIGKNQNATNEPVAYQLAQVVNTLEHLVELRSTRLFDQSSSLLQFREKIQKLRSLGCDCEDCDDACRCSQEDRRCTPLCAAHYTKGMDLFSCMLEMRNGENDTDGNDNENSDEEYTE